MELKTIGRLYQAIFRLFLCLGDSYVMLELCSGLCITSTSSCIFCTSNSQYCFNITTTTIIALTITTTTTTTTVTSALTSLLVLVHIRGKLRHQ